MAAITGGRVTPGTIIGSDISTTADILAESMRHCFKPGTNLGFAVGATPTTREECIYVATGAGVVKGFHAMCIDTGTAASVTFDLKKNGTTVLSSVITITNATTDAQVQDATLSGVPALVAGDRLTVALTVSTSTGMVGPFAYATIQETSAPV